MFFTIKNKLVFIDSMQFVNSSLNLLVKNLSDKDFKYLSEEFGDDLLELVKQKGVYPYEYMSNFKKFSEDILPDSYGSYSTLKDECSGKDYLHAFNVWNVFQINSMGDYHGFYFKKMLCYWLMFLKSLLTHV